MEAPTTTRRVLIDIDVNTAPARSAHLPSTRITGGAEKPAKVVEGASLQILLPGKMSRTVREEARLGGGKRNLDLVEAAELPSKRPKRSAGLEAGIRAHQELPLLAQGSFPGKVADRHLWTLCPKSPDTLDDLPASASSSPASSHGSSNDAMNDTQNTVITEPDTFIAGPAIAIPAMPLLPVTLSSPMTQEEVCQKARAIKLRLSLASYKVRTNQIDIPISRLQIKSTSSPKFPSLPRSMAAANVSAQRNPIIPNINIQRPSSRYSTIPSSPPPRHGFIAKETYYNGRLKSAHEDTDETMDKTVTTPILPRQRQGLLNPPNLGSPIWANEDSRSPAGDLTSSVVKGRAANGLLNLMRQQI